MRDVRRTSTFVADATLIAVCFVWGACFIAIKGVLTGTSPLAFLALRFTVAALAARAMSGRRPTNRLSMSRGILLGAILFVGLLFQTLGLARTTASRSAFITGLSLVLVPLIWFFFLGRRAGDFWGKGPARAPQLLSIAGIACALGGLYLLTAPGTSQSPLGDLFTLLGAVAFSFHIVLTDRYSRDVDPLVIVSAEMAAAAALAVVCLPFFDHEVHADGRLIAAVLLTGIVANAVAVNVQTWAQARTSAVRTAVILALEPVFAALCAIHFGEPLSMREALGGAAIVLGIVLHELRAALPAAAEAR